MRFDSLRQVALRLDLADDRFWWQVRERWVLSAIRGMLARRLTVQLPELEVDVEWLRPYQYMKGDETPFHLKRYPRLQWQEREGNNVVSRLEFLRPVDRWDVVTETKVQKVKRGFMELVSSLKFA